MTLHKFLILIPAYNEEESIGAVLQGLLKRKLPADILVINDGSIDHTRQIAEHYPVFVVSHPVNLGYGAALQTGYKFSNKMNYQFVLQFDSDGQHNPNDLLPIIEELERGQSDVVIGSRFLGDRTFNPGLFKCVAIGFFRRLIKFCTGTLVTDPTSGIRGVSRRVFTFYSIRNRLPADFPDADILIQMLLYGFIVHEVPAGNQERRAGVSMHAGLKPIIYLLKILVSTVGILISHRLRKGGVGLERSA